MNAPFDISGIRIETERMILRPWQKDDLTDFYEYASVDGVGQMAGWLPHRSMEESKTILHFFINDKKAFALELKENGKVIGSISLDEQDEDIELTEKSKGRELGFALNKKYWGRGLMPEAVCAVVSYCFFELDFDWLCCGHFLWNDQSRKVIEKCGFQYLKDVVFDTRSGTKEQGKYYIQFNPNK